MIEKKLLKLVKKKRKIDKKLSEINQKKKTLERKEYKIWEKMIEDIKKLTIGEIIKLVKGHEGKDSLLKVLSVIDWKFKVQLQAYLKGNESFLLERLKSQELIFEDPLIKLKLD